MNRLLNYITKLIICTMLSMFVTAMVTFSMIREFDMMAAGLLFGLFILPSIIIYYTLDFFHTNKAKILAFIVPLLAFLMIYAAGYVANMNRKYSEGGKGMATLILLNIFISSSIVYFTMSKVKWLK